MYFLFNVFLGELVSHPLLFFKYIRAFINTSLFFRMSDCPLLRLNAPLMAGWLTPIASAIICWEEFILCRIEIAQLDS